MNIYLIGAGPGDPSLITLKAVDILRRADVIVYDALANKTLLNYAKKDAEIIYVGKVADNHALPQAEINSLLIKKAQENKVVARLKGGDPYIFGRGGEEAEALVQAGIEFEEIPGITSTIAAPAYAGIPLTHRDMVSSVIFVTGHENPLKGTSSVNWNALAQSGATLVFVMGVKNLANICERLQKEGLDPQTPAAIIYRGTTSRQRSLIASLESLPQKALAAGFTNPSVIVVGEVVSLNAKLNWFEKKPLFGKTVVITRAREQASELASLLEDAGASVLQCPTIKISEFSSQEGLEEVFPKLSSYQWIFFTSANAVRIFFAFLEKKHCDARALAQSKIMAIGPATAEALHHYGIRADLIPERFVAESVVESFLAQNQDYANLHVLLPRAKEARDVLPDRLREAGCTVDVIPVYETVADNSEKEEIEAKIREGAISCITFTSSSTVRNFLKAIPADLLKHHPEVRLACIGPVTANTLREHGLSSQIQPEDYTIKALAEALIQELK